LRFSSRTGCLFFSDDHLHKVLDTLNELGVLDSLSLFEN
jgi:hypothetical protein